ncbi:unnamed protein product [Prorocentrum cordatum]|uniref:60S ribosomal protein L7a n=1 Tax=Prorocentrum cordatum TaxID=2364126 RepID=A0ABN9SY04_9DINO|nr:unnamed protein product [Polarella glacialis]
MGKAGAKKKLPNAPLGEKKKKAAKNPLFEKAPRNFRLGGDIQPKRNLNRFVRWPKFVRLQRMKRVMLMRLKVPPAINQFNLAIDKNQAAQLFKLMKKYMPETAEEKKARLMEMAQQKKDGQEVKTKKPQVIKYGLNHVTTLISRSKPSWWRSRTTWTPSRWSSGSPRSAAKRRFRTASSKARAGWGSSCTKRPPRSWR